MQVSFPSVGEGETKREHHARLVRGIPRDREQGPCVGTGRPAAGTADGKVADGGVEGDHVADGIGEGRSVVARSVACTGMTSDAG